MLVSMRQKELEEIFISNIEKNNLDKVKQFLSSGISVDTILHSHQLIWVGIFVLTKPLYKCIEPHETFLSILLRKFYLKVLKNYLR